MAKTVSLAELAGPTATTPQRIDVQAELAAAGQQIQLQKQARRDRRRSNQLNKLRDIEGNLLPSARKLKRQGRRKQRQEARPSERQVALDSLRKVSPADEKFSQVARGIAFTDVLGAGGGVGVVPMAFFPKDVRKSLVQEAMRQSPNPNLKAHQGTGISLTDLPEELQLEAINLMGQDNFFKWANSQRRLTQQPELTREQFDALVEKSDAG